MERLRHLAKNTSRKDFFAKAAIGSFLTIVFIMFFRGDGLVWQIALIITGFVWVSSMFSLILLRMGSLALDVSGILKRKKQ